MEIVENPIFIEDLLKHPFQDWQPVEASSLFRYQAPLLGKGTIGYCAPQEGVRLLYMNCNPTEHTAIVHKHSIPNEISLNYYIQVDRKASAHADVQVYQILHQGSIMAESTNFKRKWIQLEAGGSYEWVNVFLTEEIYKDYFKRLCRGYDAEKIERCRQAFFTQHTHGQIIHFDCREEHILREMFHCALPEGALRNCYLELKLMELMVHFFHRAMEQEAVSSPRAGLLSLAERNELDGIKCFIDTHLYDPLDYDQLFASCQTSGHRLKANFKLLYGISIGRYQQKKRMSEVLGRLMGQDDVSIKELAYEAGYSTVQAFSRAFYNEFSIRPSMVKRREGVISEVGDGEMLQLG